MKTERIGPLRVHCAGGSDGHGGGDHPAIVLCHGFGAPGDDLVSLWRAVPVGAPVRWFFPEAPIALPPPMSMGRAWWLIDMMELQTLLARGDIDALVSRMPPGLLEASQALEECLQALETTHGVTRSRTLLGGFSQGAMITTDFMLRTERPFAGLVVLSGSVIARERWADALTRHALNFPVFQSHGKHDPILPYVGAQTLREVLSQAGAKVSFVSFAGAHEIPAPVVDQLAAFARSTLSL